MPINYKNGKIYKIVSDQNGKIYIGSTAKRLLSQRMSSHRADYKKWLRGKHNYLSSFELLQYDDARIVLLKSFPCDSKDELAAEEQAWIDQFKDLCVNKIKASIGISKEEYMKNYGKEYRKDNKDKIKEKQKEYYQDNKEKMKEYYQDNKDKIKEKKKEYYQDNKDKMKEYRVKNKDRMKEYYQDNKDKISARRSQKHICECGIEYALRHKAYHQRSARHIKAMGNN